MWQVKYNIEVPCGTPQAVNNGGTFIWTFDLSGQSAGDFPATDTTPQRATKGLTE